MSEKLAVRKARPGRVKRQENLLELESKYCSWGDTVHYADKLNIFKSAKGSFLYDNGLTCDVVFGS